MLGCVMVVGRTWPLGCQHLPLHMQVFKDCLPPTACILLLGICWVFVTCHLLSPTYSGLPVKPLSRDALEQNHLLGDSGSLKPRAMP